MRSFFVLLSVFALYGCAASQSFYDAEHQVIELAPGELRTHGLAMLTPTAAFGHEEDKQTLALIFARVLGEERPDIPFVSLPDTLGAVNGAGLTADYKRMYEVYGETGIFDRDTLSRVGQVSGARYLVLLKLARFTRESGTRLSILGLRFLETKEANIRVLLQIWDSVEGDEAWEGFQELNRSRDTGKEKPVTFHNVADQTLRDLIRRLPGSTAEAASG